MGQIHSFKHLKEKREVLRRSLTPAEATLWKALKGSKLQGRKFIRQHSIENYIADFYCAEERLIVELDGQGHLNAGTQLYDSDRDENLRALNFKVIRFENKFVFENLDGVFADIRAQFKARE